MKTNKNKEEELFLDIFHDIELNQNRSFLDCEELEFLDCVTGERIPLESYGIEKENKKYIFRIYLNKQTKEPVLK